jgi:short-subunit dehydrogenase
MSFAGKTVWITGASSGIGEELAIQLSRRGAKIILTARNAQTLEAVKSRCENPNSHKIVTMDLERLEEMPAVVESVLKAGPIDILINSAGLTHRYLVKDTPFEVDRKIITLDLLSPILLTKLVLPQMLERKSGQIVSISSMMGLFSFKTRSAYCAAKHGMRGFFESLRLETVNDGIHVLMVYPGFIATPISMRALNNRGQGQGFMEDTQANGIPVRVCVSRIIRGLEQRERALIISGFKLKFAYFINRFSPALYVRMANSIKTEVSEGSQIK